MNYSHFRTVNRAHGQAVVSFNRQAKEYRVQAFDCHKRLHSESFADTAGDAMTLVESTLQALQRTHERSMRPGVNWQSLAE